MDSVKEFLVRSNIKLPSPPRVALRLLAATRKNDFSFTEIAEIIQYDPALTAKVLRVVNSAFYSLPNKISSIERALTIIGVHAVKNIAFSFNLVDGLKMNSSDNFNIDYFWKRSIIAAIGTELFKECLNTQDEDFFVAALLQDLGILIFHSNYVDEYSRLIAEKDLTNIPIDVLEKKTFGFSHQEICSEVLQQWGLPENIYLPIRHHHNYEDAPEHCHQGARILFLSSALSSIHSGIESYDKIKLFSAIIKNDLDISDSVLEQIVDRGGKKFVEICSSFEMPPEDIKPLATLLQEANEGLCDLNDSYENILVEYKKAKDRAEKLALELKAAANYDYLTGLYNRRYLVEFLDNELHLMERYGECFSIMIFDIDCFKKVNDTYGHQNGDHVLRAISLKTAEIKRSTDLLARYGGEEFVMVMPKTELQGAVMIAERLRKVIEEMDIPIDGHILKLIVSAGVTSCKPRCKNVTVAKLFDVADKALYNAKNAGRNRVATADWQTFDAEKFG